MEQKYQNKRVLVTGAGGFIGKHLCRKLTELGAEVHAVVRRPTDLTASQIHQADLTDIKDVMAVFAASQAELVYHLAGYVHGDREIDHVIASFLDNTQTTVNVLTSAYNINKPRVIIAGTMEEPGQQQSGNSGKFNCPNSPYSAAKQCSSLYAQLFSTLYQLPLTVLRLFMVYGPGQVGQHGNKLIPYVISSILKNQPPDLTSGTRLIDWIYIDDAIDAFVRAGLNDQINGAIIDVGSGKLNSIRTVVDNIMDLMNSNIEPNYRARPDRQLESERYADVEASNQLLDWRPVTDISHGLRMTIKWYKDYFEQNP